MHKALFILGMHRSGTSALARVVNLLGAELGGKIMAAASDNERGFWEHEAAVQIHEDLLTQLGHRWSDGLPLPEGWQETEAAKQAQVQIAGILDLDFLSHPLWVIKDPRLSLLFPLWVPLLKERGIEPLAIVAWRDPAEVAASLKKRDGMEESAALLCWLAYTIESLKHALDFPHAVIGYDALLKDWRGSLKTLAAELNLVWPQWPEAEVEAFLAPELRHHQASGVRHQASGLSEVVEDCLALLAHPDTAKIAELHRRWHDYALPLAGPLREARREASDWRERALNAEHHAKDVENQREQLHAAYVRTIEREKETLVHNRMLDAALTEMRESTSWKITEPLRKMKKKLG